MDAGTKNLLSFLGQNQQLTIPLYQRKYSWTERECNQLFEDILRVANSEENNHFIGSIVYMKQNAHMAGPIDDLMVIDGQQRITTISLLISALSDYLFSNRNENVMSPDNLINYYLINDKETGGLRYKLILTEDDKNAFIKIVDNLTTEDKIPYDDYDSIRVIENYDFFKKKIDEENVELIYRGLSKLQIIDVGLEYGKDKPQLIFESLNSTGLLLSPSDLIRNYILMGLEPEEQEKLYTEYWRKIEKLFEEEGSWVFDRFIRDYLTVKTDKVPTKKNIYMDFKKFSKHFDQVELLVRDIFKFSSYFSCIAFGKEQKPKLREALDSLNSMGYDVTYPFLMHLYKDFDAGSLSEEEFVEIIRYTESYLLRRLICGIPTASHNKTFAKMYNDLDKENYSESYQAVLVLKENYQRMPNDEEFPRNFAEKDIYNLRGNKLYIFDKFENWGSKEPHPIDSYTIEHIMPQNPNLSDKWKEDLGNDYKEIQKRYLHTIGNLTLTGYNPELSDKSFIEKRDMQPGGFKDSPFRMNFSLRNLEKWDEDEIKKRRDWFINRALAIWEYPQLSDEVLERYNSHQEFETIYEIGVQPNLYENSLMRPLFDELSERITSLDNNIIIQPMNKYVSFISSSKKFVSIYPYKRFLKIWLFKIPFDELYDSENRCSNIEDDEYWSSTTTELRIKSLNDIEYAIDIIRQSYDYVNNH